MSKKMYPPWNNYDELEFLDNQPKQLLNRSQSVTLDDRVTQPYRQNYRNMDDDWMRYPDQYGWNEPTITDNMNPIPKRGHLELTHKEISLKKREKDILTKEYNEIEKDVNSFKNSNKQKMNKAKNVKQKIVERQKKWENERKTMLLDYNGKIPEEITELDKLRNGVNDLKNKNTAFKTSLNISEEHWSKSLKKIETQLKLEKQITNQTYSHNKKLNKRVEDLKSEKVNVNNELKKKEEITNKQLAIKNANGENIFNHYPPESTVIQNLLQAQVEYYFSDYNLKRDKKLLADVCKIPKGFLTIKQVMHLSRIRQLCSETNQLIEALKRSKILTLKKLTECQDYIDSQKEKELKKDESQTKQSDKDSPDNDADNKDESEDVEKDDKLSLLIGREKFSKPKEKEFPFRRTVFAFGIKQTCTKEELKEILSPFGQVVKIQFDSGVESAERKIGLRFLNKPRIYELYRPAKLEQILAHLRLNDTNNSKSKKNSLPAGQYMLEYKIDEKIKQRVPIKMSFLTKHRVNNDDIQCHKCNKSKPVSEGFYTSKQWKNIFCSQCGAQLAEEQLNQYYKDKSYPKKKWLGDIPKDINKRKTALVVFASQRQASKCAYVRTRIAYNGVFATHFHHYSKIKKEIEFNIEHLNDVNNNQNNNKSGSYTMQQRRNYNKNNFNKNNYSRKYYNNSGKRHIRNLRMPPGTNFIRQSTAPVFHNNNNRGRNRPRYRNKRYTNRNRGGYNNNNNRGYNINMNKPIPSQQQPPMNMFRSQIPVPKPNRKFLFRQKSAPITK